jgi:hypothetical protein
MPQGFHPLLAPECKSRAGFHLRHGAVCGNLML